MNNNIKGHTEDNGSNENKFLTGQDSESQLQEQAEMHNSDDGMCDSYKPKLKKVNRDKYRKHGSDKKHEVRDRKSSRNPGESHYSRCRSRSPRRRHREDRRSRSRHRSSEKKRRHVSAKSHHKDNSRSRSRSKSIEIKASKKQDNTNEGVPDVPNDRRRPHSHSQNRTSKRRIRSRSRSPRSRHRGRSRSRSRKRGSHSKKTSRRSRSTSRRRSRRSSSSSPYQFGFDKAMDAQERLARRLERAKELTRQKKAEEAKIIAEKGLMHLQGEELRVAIEKAAKSIVNSAQSTVPQSSRTSELAAAQLVALKQQAEAETGISVPSYYNPLVVNPLQYAQQEAKRKKLWSKKESVEEKNDKTESKKDNDTVWSKISLGNNKSDEKFAKLMGIKQTNLKDIDENNDVAKKQQELMTNLNMQYQQARVVTHTQRGMGLGFSTGLLNPNAMSAQQANQQLGINNPHQPSA